MVKPNFLLTAAGLHMGLLALSYWFSRSGNEEEASEASASGNDSRNESATVCEKCHQAMAVKDITTLACGHRVHQHCFEQMQGNNLVLICPVCTK